MDITEKESRRALDSAIKKEFGEEYAKAPVNVVLFYNRACYRTLKAMLPPRNDALLVDRL
jgi:hypothetical protein